MEPKIRLRRSFSGVYFAGAALLALVILALVFALKIPMYGEGEGKSKNLVPPDAMEWIVSDEIVQLTCPYESRDCFIVLLQSLAINYSIVNVSYDPAMHRITWTKQATVFVRKKV
ncbi:MAG: hypothetical protein UT91_C0024G0012 [Parcubacteria group bacterium GW2011_GWA2_40_23]|nr:MAG: hypothetical protein UT91_C0024G0012 [Parcubacteria group bacterium GW2011_GWA2_40_23]